jgi:signal peptidase II
MSVRWPRPSFYAVILLVIALDQLTKAWETASAGMRERVVPVIPGFFNLVYGQNTGIAFGMFQGHGLLVGLFIVMLAMVALYYAKGLNWASWEPNLVGGCLCGGALSNLLDRARLGYVVDFLDVYIGTHHWPTFNVADSVICLAVGWIVLRQLGIGESKVRS